MVWPKFGIESIKASLYPAYYQLDSAATVGIMAFQPLKTNSSTTFGFKKATLKIVPFNIIDFYR